MSYNYLDKVMERISQRFSPEECKQLSYMLDTICDQLMPEIPLPKPGTLVDALDLEDTPSQTDES